MTLTLVVPGAPRGKGRPRFARSGHAFTDAKTRNYEAYIKALFVQKYPDFTPLEGPLEMEIGVYFAVPASASKKRKQDMLWQHKYPVKRPDCSNALKACEDALNTLAYRDDAQLVSVLVTKKYALSPKVEIRVRPVGEEP